MVTITEYYIRNQSVQLRANIHSKVLHYFPSGSVVVSYNGIDLKLRDSSINDKKSLKISSGGTNNIVSLSRIEDRHNWIGKFELAQDGKWYILQRIND